MKVEIKIVGPRASGKSYLMRHIEREIRSVCKHITDLNRSENATVDGIPAEILELEVSM